MESERNITNDLVTEYIQGFYQPLTENLNNLRKKAEANKVPIILKETESFFAMMLEMQKPKRILEIGCAIGYSSMFFAECCGAEVVTIEKNHETFLEAKNNIESFGFSSKIRVIEGDGEEALNMLFQEGEEPFDMIFIDAAKSHYKRFFEAALPLCSDETIIYSDNVLFHGRVASDLYDTNGKYKTNTRKMREYVSWIHQDSRFQSVILAIGDGLAITKFKKK